MIEALVYIALFTIVVGGLMAAAYGFFESSDRNQTKSMLQAEQDFILAKIDWVLDGAQSVSVPAANASGGTLAVLKYDGTTHTVTTIATDITLGGSVLNNSNTTVSNLRFIHTRLPGIQAPESVEAGFTISAHTPNGMMVSQSASTTRYLHK